MLLNQPKIKRYFKTFGTSVIAHCRLPSWYDLLWEQPDIPIRLEVANNAYITSLSETETLRKNTYYVKNPY